MAIAFRASAGAGVTGTSLTINKPTGTVDGDVMVAAICARSSGAVTCTPPTGWEEVIVVDRLSASSTIIGRLFVYRKVASGEDANYAFTISQSSQHVGEILTWSGVDNTTPIDGTPQGNNSTAASSETAHVTPSMTTTVANAEVVRVAHGLRGGTAGAYSWPTSTERSDRSYHDSGANIGTWVSAATATKATAGATGTETATSSEAARWCAATLALTPASTGTTVAVGQASETDTAQAVTARKTATAGQPVESDAAQPVSVNPQHRLVGQASEAGTAQPVAVGKARTVGQASEADTAQPASAAKRLTVGQASGIGQALSVTPLRTYALARAVETDTAASAAALKTLPVGQALEQAQAQAQALAALKKLAAGQASETGSALAITAALGSVALTATVSEWALTAADASASAVTAAAASAGPLTTAAATDAAVSGAAGSEAAVTAADAGDALAT